MKCLRPCTPFLVWFHPGFGQADSNQTPFSSKDSSQEQSYDVGLPTSMHMGSAHEVTVVLQKLPCAFRACTGSAKCRGAAKNGRINRKRKVEVSR